MKRLVKNGKIVTPEKTFKGDILIDDGIIKDIAPHIKSDAEVIDASGLFVLPGGVDVHTHLNLKLGDRQVGDGFYEGMRAAAFGGTTTIVDHPEGGPKGCSLHHQPDYYKKLLLSEAVIDYGIHGIFQRADEDILNEIPELISKGVTSMKAYLTYDDMLTNSDIDKILNKMKHSGGITAFHAEDDTTIKYLRDKYGKDGKLAPIYHAKSRPAESEALAIQNILDIAGDAPVYIVHLSTRLGLEVIKKARLDGKTVYAETCPQYLLLDESYYEREDGIKYIMAPPLRTKEDTDALWKAVINGDIDVIATDHCSFSCADKIKFGQGDFRKVPGGAPGVETRLPLIFSEGVINGRISINRFVELVAEKPAQIMGMYPKKGCIKIGADADIVLWDAELTKTISVKELHQKCDYTPYEGMEVTGWPRTVILKGEIIVNKDELLIEKGFGEYINRNRKAIGA